MVDQIESNCKSHKLIEDVGDIQTKKVLDDELEKHHLTAAVTSPSISKATLQNPNNGYNMHDGARVHKSELEEAYDYMTPRQFSRGLNSYPQNFKFD